MKKPAVIYTIIITFILLAAMVIPVTAAGAYGDKIETDTGNDILAGMGISTADQQSMSEQVKSLQVTNKGITTPQTAALHATGSYTENSMEKITTKDGKPFEGGTTIKFVISPDNSVSGNVDFKFIEQGWTITIHGTVNGTLTPDTGKLVIHSSDAVLKYAGKNYPIVMEVEAQYNGSSFDGTKQLTMAGTSGTLGFHATVA
jgi:hypothetical protein